MANILSESKLEAVTLAQQHGMNLSNHHAMHEITPWSPWSSPLPQLFPNLDERLHLFRSRKPTVDQPAISVRLVVKAPHGLDAEVSEIVTEFPEVLLAQNFSFVTIGTPGHGKWS
jgi:hypothetical protein